MSKKINWLEFLYGVWSAGLNGEEISKSPVVPEDNKQNATSRKAGITVGMLRVMSRRGDDRVTWDGQKVSAGDPEAVAAIREAERIFAQERAKGATAFRVSPGKPAERIEQFDKKAEQIVLVPRVVGG